MVVWAYGNERRNNALCVPVGGGSGGRVVSAGGAGGDACSKVGCSVEVAGQQDPRGGSACEGKCPKGSCKNFVDCYLGAVPMRPAKANDVGVVAADGDGARRSSWVQLTVREQKLNRERGTVGLGAFRP